MVKEPVGLLEAYTKSSQIPILLPVIDSVHMGLRMIIVNLQVQLGILFFHLKKKLC